MEQQKNKLTLTKPNAFVMSLQKDSIRTIAKFSRYTPITVEAVIEYSDKCKSRIEDLERAQKFYETEYKGSETLKEEYLSIIKVELSHLRIELVFASTPQPMGLIHQLHEKECENSLCLLINDLREFFLVENMINTKGILALAPLVIGEFPGLSLEEVTICFAQAKKGYYGEVYNRLDGQIILKWLRLYQAEKVERIKQKQQERHVTSKSDIQRRDYIDTRNERIQLAHAAIALERSVLKK
ncbi:hypothetical protein [Pedobacter sp. MW01-1-1]|uniref:hypothetical protein n=1 Tax=Pedobacter sp. MW01-1-1 TaxID=3383027 RepID=UPI003FED47C6